MGVPERSLPRAIRSFEECSRKSREPAISPSFTGSTAGLGTSIPTAAFPGIGASILTPCEARFIAMSSARFAILLTFTPGSGWTSNLVTAGPWFTATTVASIPNERSVSSRARFLTSMVSRNFSSLCLSFSFGWSSSVSGGSWYLPIFFGGW